MKYLKLFEAGLGNFMKYDNIEIQYDDIENLFKFDDDGNYISFVCFTDKEIDNIRKFFAIKGMKISLHGAIGWSKEDVYRIVSSKARPSLYFDIDKLEDEWYFVEVQYYDKKDECMLSKYYKCDQIDGLKEVLLEYIGTIPDQTKELEKINRDKLLKQVYTKIKFYTKIKSMTNDQLEELLNKI
jgi:hypothetical protein